jgi:hypothetical protein
MLATLSNDKFTIEYDRSGREYQVIDLESGEITEKFPSKAKGEAFRFAVELFEPPLFAAAMRMIDKYPYMERVVWRAVELVINNAVEVFDVPQGNVIAMVESSDGMGRYAIAHDYSCQCEHFTSFAAPMTDSGRVVCKHVGATYLWRVARETRF